jgi:hypothetical protein
MDHQNQLADIMSHSQNTYQEPMKPSQNHQNSVRIPGLLNLFSVVPTTELVPDGSKLSPRFLVLLLHIDPVPPTRAPPRGQPRSICYPPNQIQRHLENVQGSDGMLLDGRGDRPGSRCQRLGETQWE